MQKSIFEYILFLYYDPTTEKYIKNDAIDKKLDNFSNGMSESSHSIKKKHPFKITQKLKYSVGVK